MSVERWKVGDIHWEGDPRKVQADELKLGRVALEHLEDPQGEVVGLVYLGLW